MTVPRWTMVRAEYPSATIEVGPEDLTLLRQALSALMHTYPETPERWSDDERVRLADLRANCDNLWYELMKTQRSPKTVKQVFALDIEGNYH